MPKKKQTLLVVDDDTMLLEALEAKFTSAGYKVLTAKDGAQGFILATTEHPDLILLDLVMPRIDGLTMLKNLRDDPWGKEAQVIILTNIEDNSKLAEAMSGGVYDYLVKSDWKIDDIVSKVNEKFSK